MSVANGQRADQNTFNSSFVSRETDSNTVGVLALDNTLPASGPVIPNLQKAVNQLTRTSPVLDSIPDGDSLALDPVSLNERRRVQGLGAPIVMDAQPFGAGPFVDGKLVRLMGFSDVDTVTINQSLAAGGAKINGGSITLFTHETADFEWVESSQLWVLVGRNN